MILLIDNYDSFTFNLVHFFGDLGAECVVRRNDALSPEEALALHPEAIVLSPGPCTPNEAGICLDLIGAAGGERHAVVGRLPGASGDRPGIWRPCGARAASRCMARPARFMHENSDVFAGLPNPFTATRYHSLIVQRSTLPETLVPTAWTEDGIIMGLRHVTQPIYGVQFHPESIATSHGHEILKNFLDLVRGT